MSGSHLIMQTNNFLLINATAVTFCQAHRKFIQYISPCLYILCPKYQGFAQMVLMWVKSLCGGGGGKRGSENKLKT